MNASRLTSACSPVIEELESRQLLAVTLADGVLTVAGSGKGDNIRIKTAGSQIVVNMGHGSKRFARADVDQVVVRGKGGGDRINLTGHLGDVNVDGGSGDDKILGSGGGDFITGGSGDDEISGRGGNDQLYGDAGDDEIFGGVGDDTLGGDDEDMIFNSDVVPTLEGDDVLNGGSGNDWLLSGTESDIHVDPSGDDELTGGPGADIVDKRGLHVDDPNTASDNSIVGMEDGSGDTAPGFDAGTDILPVSDVTGPIPAGEDYDRHIHAFLKIFINGVQMLIPDRVGEFLGQPVAHTHERLAHENPPKPEDVRGMELHFHNTDGNRAFTLGEFFRNWGISLSSENIGRWRVDANHTLTMTVAAGGNAAAPNSQFDNYVIQTDAANAHMDVIVIRYDTV